MAPRAPAVDEAARIFDERADAYGEPDANYRYIADAKQQTVARFTGPTSLVLDIGCGPGREARLVAPGARCVVGVDLSHQMLRRAVGAPSRGRMTFVRGRADVLPFRDGTFDVAYSFATLPVLDVRAALREIHRVLRPGGVVVFDMGNRSSLEGWYQLRHSPFPLEYWSGSPIDVAEALGFRVVDVRHTELVKPLLFHLPAQRAWNAGNWAGKLLMGWRWRDRTPEEWISSLPGLRRFAFRWLMSCRKT